MAKTFLIDVQQATDPGSLALSLPGAGFGRRSAERAPDELGERCADRNNRF
jgi:hypothetical protein